MGETNSGLGGSGSLGNDSVGALEDGHDVLHSNVHVEGVLMGEIERHAILLHAVGLAVWSGAEYPGAIKMPTEVSFVSVCRGTILALSTVMLLAACAPAAPAGGPSASSAQADAGSAPPSRTLVIAVKLEP